MGVVLALMAFLPCAVFFNPKLGRGGGGGEEIRPLLDPPLSTCSKTTFMQLNDSNLMDTLMCDSCTAI